jgi:hypothetical protein
MKVWSFNYLSFEMIPMDSHLMFKSPAPLPVEKIDLNLAGGVVRCGQTIHGMFGRRTCAGYTNFHPVAPACVVFLGMYSDLHGDVALCANPEWSEDSLYIGWNAVAVNGRKMLLSLVKAQNPASRVVNTEFLFLDGDMPPAGDVNWKTYQPNANGEARTARAGDKP